MKNYIISAFSDEAGNDLHTQIDALKRNDIPGMEIRAVDGGNIADISHPRLREIKAELDGAGIAVYNIGSPIGKINVRDDFAPHLDKFKYLLDSALVLEAQRMRIFSFYLEQAECTAYRDTVMERLSILSDTARGSGVLLCHENEKDIFGEGADNCVDIARSVPAIRLIFDPANLVVAGHDVASAWQKMKGYTEYLHIKDALADGTIVPAGAGEGMIPGILGEFEGTHITLEPHLAVFDGLKSLEKEGSAIKVGGGYSSNGEAFDAAAKALYNIIGEIG